jgi:hypothetical protein
VQNKQVGIGFAVDANVHIEVISPQNVIRQQIDKHNRATHHMLEGILSYIRGDFTTSYRQLDSHKLKYKEDAKNHIPCYINLGTGGVVLDDEGVPLVDPESPRVPTLSDEWVSPENIVKTSDSYLANEIGTEQSSMKSRVEISVLSTDDKEAYNDDYIDTDLVNSVIQLAFSADVPTGHSNIYGISVPAFITEIGLFASPTPGKPDLLARVILKKDDEVLYVRPQDTVVVTWVISIIAIDDQSLYHWDEPIKVDSYINENITPGDINIDV